jgi:hypothetical protein
VEDQRIKPFLDFGLSQDLAEELAKGLDRLEASIKRTAEAADELSGAGPSMGALGR